MRIKQSGLQGFTLVEIMVVVGIIGLLASIAIPNFARSRTVAQRNVCIENLAQLESAKQIFGVEKGKQNGDGVSEADLIGPTLYMRKMPLCPSGGAYEIMPIGESAECQYKVDLKHVIEEPVVQ